MYQTISFQDFKDAFQNMNRGDNFSYEGLRVLFDYLEDLEQSLEEPIELDVIALCCEYTEITDDEDCYRDYIGDDAERDDLIVAILESSVIVREG